MILLFHLIPDYSSGHVPGLRKWELPKILANNPLLKGGFCTPLFDPSQDNCHQGTPCAHLGWTDLIFENILKSVIRFTSSDSREFLFIETEKCPSGYLKALPFLRILSILLFFKKSVKLSGALLQKSATVWSCFKRITLIQRFDSGSKLSHPITFT